MSKNIKQIIDFIEYSEGLKTELRNSWLSDDRQESVAEHSWRMSIIAMAIASSTKLNLDMAKVLKMAAIHDIAEIEAGDVPTIYHMVDEAVAAKKEADEKSAIDNIHRATADTTGEEIYSLWNEFEAQTTNEAKFVKIIDKFEAITQKYQASLASYNRQDAANRAGAPGYFEKLEKMCEIDDYLVLIFKELVARRNEIKFDRLSELG